MNTNDKKAKKGRAPVEAGVIVKFAMDVHADQITVQRQIGGQVAQPAQKLSWLECLAWIEDHVAQGAKVYSCYEAGPCGYGLHRQLVQMGVTNYVVAPQCWDLSGRRVKTDQRDAGQLGIRLDQYQQGNTRAFTVVLVPTPEQEARRALCRHRDALVKERQRCIVRGSGLMLMQGVHVAPDWWASAWPSVSLQLPSWLREQVVQWREQALQLDQAVEALSTRLSALAQKPWIKGYGALTSVLIDAEVLDWSRFQNRRQVASFCGLCPSEHSSGKNRRQGSINKHGNPRIRHHLVEAIWRLLYWQPNYKPLAKLRAAQGGRARKRAAVAAARHLMIDLWRIRTGRCTAESLGLILAD